MSKHHTQNFARLFCTAETLWLVGCASQATNPGAPQWGKPKSAQDSTPATQPAIEAEQPRLYKGTGQLIKGQLPGGALPGPPPGAVAAGPAVTLNFEAADLRDVVRNILTDIL